MPTVMAEVIGKAEIAEVQEKGQFQDSRLLRAILDRPGGSLTQWAIDCGWLFRQSRVRKRHPAKR